MAESSKGSSCKDKMKQWKDVFYKNGIDGLAKKLKENLSAWEETSLKIAVTGRSGTGKSTFINSLRGITADDEDKDPAAVGVNETTKEVRGYKYPGNDKFIVYDVPGLGTKLFKQEHYLAGIKADEYDFFIIMTKNRFLEDDLWLAEQLHTLQKRFYFVRTNCHDEIINDKKAHPKSHNQVKVLQSMRDDIRKNLGSKFADAEIFLIDSYEPALYDFATITKRMITDSKSIKKDAFAFSLICLSTDVIEEKKKRLEERKPTVLLWCFINQYFLERELELYKRTFGIDSKSLEEGANVLKLDESWCDEQTDDVNKQHNQLMEFTTTWYKEVINWIPYVGNARFVIRADKTLDEALDRLSRKAIEVYSTLGEGLANVNIA